MRKRKGWNDLTLDEKREAFLNLEPGDIGEGPGKWNKAAFISRLAEAGFPPNDEIFGKLRSKGLLEPSHETKESSG